MPVEAKRVVRRLYTGKQQVGSLARRDSRNEPRDRDRIGALDRVVPHTDRPIRALGEALAQRLVGIVGADTHGDDFDRSRGGLLDLHRLFERVIVPFVEVTDQKIGIHILTVGADLEVLVQRGHLLDGYEDFHVAGLIVD